LELRAVSYSIFHTAAFRNVKMPQKISPEAFFVRASNNVAIDKKKDVINGK
jgi:hypothetical protein